MREGSTFLIKQNGISKCEGCFPEAFYSELTIKSMKANGCKIYVDGKLYTGSKPKGKPCGNLS